MKRLLRHWRIAIAAICAAGGIRIGFYYLVYEPLTGQGRARIGREFEPLRPLLGGAQKIGYLSDEPLDADARLPRRFDVGDMMYARAQYALAPTLLAHGDRNQSLLLANFVQAAALEREIGSGRYRVIAQPGGTIALLRRR